MKQIYERPSKTILPCKCGTKPVLCYYDYVKSFNGTYGSSVYEKIRFYAYICPHCKEWATNSEYPFVAARFWNQQMQGKRKIFDHKAENFIGILWRNVETDEIITGKPIEDYNCWGKFQLIKVVCYIYNLYIINKQKGVNTL